MAEFIGWITAGFDLAQHGEFYRFGAWAYILIMMLVATEGPITTLVGAAAAAAGLLDLRLVFLATMVGNVAGDVLWYSAGYAGKIDRLHCVSKYAGVRREHLDALCSEIQLHATKAILVSKITFGLIVPMLVAAGLARVHWRRWFPAVLVAETLWSLLLVTLGYHAAGAISQVERGLRFGGVVAALTVVTFVLVFAVHKIKSLPAKPHSSPRMTHDPIADVQVD